MRQRRQIGLRPRGRGRRPLGLGSAHDIVANLLVNSGLVVRWQGGRLDERGRFRGDADHPRLGEGLFGGGGGAGRGRRAAGRG